ncbi:hypothetical protein ACFLZL_00165 [Thermodesulfobacteriota bacterium]
MTHSLHREGNIESLEKDYTLFIYPARGFNFKCSASKVRHLVEILYQAGPANMIANSLRRNAYSGVKPDEVLDSIKDGTRVFSVFNNSEKVKEVLKSFKSADEGISIVVGGLIDRVRDIAADTELEPHTLSLSLGVHGQTDRLPSTDIRELTTMCGHGMISPASVQDVIRKVKSGKINTWEASLILAEPCACGIYNPHRSKELLEELLPLYMTSRY